MTSKIIYTRKQLWRRCKTYPIYKNFNDVEKSNDLEGNQYISNNNIGSINGFNLKKVRFSNIAHLTLIPTRKELDDLDRFYNSHYNFINLKEE